MATQYEDPCVLWVRSKDDKQWVRYFNYRFRQVAEERALKFALADGYYKLGETMKIISPKEDL